MCSKLSKLKEITCLFVDVKNLGSGDNCVSYI
jgi:hypothetical protein